jgi:integrase/recombinase XerD
MRLHQVVQEYIAHKQALGMRFQNERYAMRSFCRIMGNIQLRDADPAKVMAFIGDASRPGRWRCYYRILNSFYRYALDRGLAEHAPFPRHAPRFPPQTRPYIYTTAELRQLLAAASGLPTVYSPLQPATYRTLLLLLYGAALRVSEAINLTLGDVDIAEKTLVIRKTKFFKQRLVPVGTKLARTLSTYLENRRRLPLPSGDTSQFFCNRTGRGLDRGRVEQIFRRLCLQVGIRRSGGPRAQPRLHDLRHTSATDHLIAWYEAGEDVERLLPHLATYLGHNGVHSTQCYLSLTPRLLQKASARFHRYFAGELS